MSNCLLFLSAEDFHLEKSKLNDSILMCNGFKGLSLVLFYGKECPHCQKLIPIFKKLAGRVNGLFVAMSLVNIDIVKLSRNSATIIEYVPLIILYLNGVPYMKYDSEASEDAILSFIMDINKRLQIKEKMYKYPQQNQQLQILQQNTNKRHKNSVIPVYSLGVPIKEDDISYFEFNERDGYIKFNK